MKAAHADFTFLNLPGAVHGFSNPAATELGKKFKMPLAYQKAADDASWEAMKQLFHTTLDTPKP
ncbi:MAG: dienelactone hydrolase family protein [Verrucomicrobiales bacterium]